jgi:hypothetical protein
MNSIILALALALGTAGAAVAQTASPCGGAAPAAGEEIRGPILHVVDGRTLCVARGGDPSRWTQVTLGDAPAQASWGGLMSVAFGKDAACVAQGGGRTAICRVDGRSLGPQLRTAEVEKAGVGWRRPAEAAPGAVRERSAMQVASGGD